MPDQATAEDLAPSSSGCSRAAAMSDGASVEENMLRPPWVILAAVAVDPPSPAKSAAVAVDFALSLYEPPRVSALTVSRRISSASETPGSFAYVVAVDPAGCFLLYATQGRAAPAFFVCDPHTGAASRLPDPAVGRPLQSFESVGFISYHGGSGGGSRYMVADLQPADGTGGATLLRHWIDTEGWTMEEVKYPSESSPRHPPQWRSSTVVSKDDKLYWIDTLMGIVSCDAFLDYPVLRYVPLPEGCDLPAGTADLDKRRRWVGISAGKLRYLKIDGIPGHPSFNLWTLTDELSWSHEYQANFKDIFNSKELEKINRNIEEIAIALVHPRMSDVIYFTLDQEMHMVDLCAMKTKSTDMEKETARSFSFFRAWELPGSLLLGIDSSFSNEIISTRVFPAECAENEGELISHLSTSPCDASIAEDNRRRSLTRLCHQGVKAGQVLASQLGVTASTMGSNLFYLNEEVSDAKSYFKHMGDFKSTGQGYVAQYAGKSAKISKTISRFLGGAGSALSYGGTALSAAGFSLQRWHPQAQTGGSGRNAIKEMITVESIQEAEQVLEKWLDTKVPVSVDVPPQMETGMAQNIMKRFKLAEALELVEKSPNLMEKAAKVLDDASDWDMV